MALIGNPIVSTDFPVDYFSGNGSTTAFTLSIAPASVNAVDVEVSGVSQSPQTYTISGTTLTFSAAPPSGTNNIVIKHRGIAGSPNVPSAASVTSDKLATQTSIPFATSSLGAGNASIMKNRIINGAMVIDQRNAGASVTPTNGQYTLDRWQSLLSQASKYSVQQNSGNAPATQGFTQCLKITSLSAYTLGATDFFQITQPIEGNNIADLAWGTASGKTVTVSFWAYSSLTGSFSVALGNSAGNSWYPVLYSIPVANTWTQISVTVPAPPNGTTWLTTNGIGIDFRFSLGTGSTYSNTSGAWNSGQSAATGATSVVGTNGATFYITGVQLEVGSSATGYEYRQYGQELALCQRYYEVGTLWGTGYGNGSNGVIFSIPLKTSKRTTPSGTATDGGSSVNATGFTFTGGDANSCNINFGSNSGYIRGNATYTVSAEL